VHDWDVSVAEARAIQQEFGDRVEERDRFGPLRTVAGIDVSYDRGKPDLFAAVVVLDAESLEVVESAGARRTAGFPYVPGYLSFREIPAVLEAWSRLQVRPDLVVCDGHGRAHPRRFGLACHLGVWLDVASIGCAKSRLVGSFREPGPRRGASTRLLDGREVIGRVLRTREATKPIFVSIGHRVSLASAERELLRLAPRYRLPEPIRAAHAEVNRLRRSG
jgi:deoxyribonuclease V